MSNDWQLGDLALCIKGGPIHQFEHGEWPVAGRVYPVTDLKPNWEWDDGDVDLGLMLDGAPLNGPQGWPLWWHGRFIKVTPEEADDFDREVIEQLEGVRA